MIDHKKFLNNLPVIVYAADPDTYQVSYINEAITDVYGYTVTECLETPDLWIRSIHPDDRDRVLQETEEHKRIGEGILQYRVFAKNGEVKWVSDHTRIEKNKDGENICIFGSLVDITPQQEQLEYARQNLDELLEESATVIYRCDPSGDFSATFVSNNVKRQLSYTPEDFTGDPQFWASNIHPDDRDKVFSSLGALFEKGHHSHEYRFWHGDGYYVWMHDDLRLVKGADGQVRDIIGNWIDITWSKQLELEKLEHEQHLQQARKMQAVGTLAGGVAHEFNNMLGIISGYTELLMELDNLSDKGQSYLEYIQEAVGRSESLVKQLLSFSHKSPKKIEPLFLADKLKEEIKFLSDIIPSSVDLKLHIKSANSNVLADSAEFRQIMINLVMNAAYVMKNKGTISIEMDEITVQGVSDIKDVNLKPGVYTKISVTDTGEGIKPEIQNRIFEPFFTTKDVGSGTGMGLALVYSIMEAYGGTVQVKSDVGTGSTFSLYFPIENISAGRADTDVAPIIQSYGIKKDRILFVDDESMFAELYQIILSEFGYHVEVFTDSQEALLRIQSSPDSFDILITDQIMPNLLGTELIEEAKKVRQDIHTILCTGYSEDMNKIITKNLGIQGYIEKPFSRGELLNEIKKAITKTAIAS